MPTESKYFVSLFGLLGGLLTSSGLYAAVPAFSTQSPWMLGDWNSNRTQLEQQGYQFSLGYTGEMASLIDAKNNDKHKTEYTDQFALGAHFDLEKIMGWRIQKPRLLLLTGMAVHFRRHMRPYRDI